MLVRLLAGVLRIAAAFMIPAAAISFAHGETAALHAFLITIVIMLAISCVSFLFPPKKRAFYAREGFVLAALTWFMVSLLGALPFVLSGVLPNYIDALFETASGFSTTGASVMTNLTEAPRGILYWRSFTHWLGGMGVLVFLLSLESLGSGSDSMHIMRAESPGPQVSKLVPHTMSSARILYGIYIGMTLVLMGLLLLGGMNLFDAVTTALGTAGTGGFGTRPDSMASFSPFLQWVVGVFMALFGVNFGIYYLILQRSFKKAFRNAELWLYVGMMAVSTVIIAWQIFPEYGLGSSVRHGFFQVSSIMTTTGFATADFDRWPQLARTLLVMLSLIGACAGSTGGGFKISRLLILFKSLKREMQRVLHPKSIVTVHIDGEPISKDTIGNTYAFLVAYCLIMALSILLMSLDKTSFEANVTAVIACLNNIGPGLGQVGPMGGYAELSSLSKLVLTMNMLLGRLEIFLILILFMPGVWKKARS